MLLKKLDLPRCWLYVSLLKLFSVIPTNILNQRYEIFILYSLRKEEAEFLIKLMPDFISNPAFDIVGKLLKICRWSNRKVA